MEAARSLLGRALGQFGVVLLCVLLPVDAIAASWRGIKPAISTRADVTRILGPSANANNLRAIYDLDDAYVYIAFSNTEPYMDKCVSELPQDTVLLIEVRPKRKATLRSLGFDVTSLSRFDASEPKGLGIWGYVDARAGIVIRTYKGIVTQIDYIASRRDLSRCLGYYSDPKSFVSVLIEPSLPVCAGITADPINVEVGRQVKLTVNASTPDGKVMTFTWTTTGGRLIGSGTNVTLDTSSMTPGTYTITAQTDDGFGHTVECSTTITVTANIEHHAPESKASAAPPN